MKRPTGNTWLMILIFFLAAGGLAYLISQVDPRNAGLIKLSAVYLAIFLLIFSLASLAGGYRQGALLGTLGSLTLWLVANHLLSFITAGLVIFIFTLLEIYAISR